MKIEDVIDAPEVFVSIRNALVHGKEKKRKELMEIELVAKYEALQLGLWYIELALLFILGFKGNYYSRASGKEWLDNGEPLPWNKITQ